MSCTSPRASRSPTCSERCGTTAPRWPSSSTTMVRGDVNAENVNEATGIDFPEGEEFETIAGFVFTRAGRLVDVGERFEYEDTTIVVDAVENTRIQWVRIVEEPDTSVEESDADATVTGCRRRLLLAGPQLNAGMTSSPNSRIWSSTRSLGMPEWWNRSASWFSSNRSCMSSICSMICSGVP